MTRSQRIAATAEEIWAVISDAHHLPRWWPGVTRVENVARDRFTEVIPTRRGKPMRLDFRIVESRALERLTWTQDLQGTPFERLLSAWTTTVTLLPDGDACIVTLEEQPAAERLAPRRRTASAASGTPAHGIRAGRALSAVLTASPARLPRDRRFVRGALGTGPTERLHRAGRLLLRLERDQQAVVPTGARRAAGPRAASLPFLPTRFFTNPRSCGWTVSCTARRRRHCARCWLARPWASITMPATPSSRITWPRRRSCSHRSAR